MDIIYNKIFLNHTCQGHPENPDRLAFFKDIKETKVKNGEKYLELVHTGEYINKVKKASQNESFLDVDTYTNNKTYEVACCAVIASIAASETKNFALVRPPGHHAFSDRGSGFCIFNNIAIASKNLINQGKKVFILDFDNHHGNGTSSIFYNSDKVLYLSTHVYPYYPGTGWVDEIGEGIGKGYTINIPLPQGVADDILLDSLNYFIPIVKNKFNPDVIAVSAGFDAHYADHLSGMKFSLNAYYNIGQILSQNFDNIFSVLEGGYNPAILAQGVENFIAGINDRKMKHEDIITQSDIEVKKEYEKRINMLKENLKGHFL